MKYLGGDIYQGDCLEIMKKLPDQSSSSYFKEFFDLTIKPLPIISVVANFCKDPYIKNHELFTLFKAP